MKKLNRSIAVGELEFMDLSYAPRDRQDWHRHARAEFCFLVEGALAEQVRGGMMRYARHDLGFKPAEVMHSVVVSETGARCLVVAMSGSWLARHEAASNALVEPCFFTDPSARSVGLRFVDELSRVDSLTPLVVEGLALELLACVGRIRAMPVPLAPPRWLERVREHLHEHPVGDRTLADLAALVGVRPTRLAQAFRRHYHCTAGDYLRKLRVTWAGDLLSRTALPLPQVAEACGFYDQSHLTKVFRRYTGATPAQFRRRHPPRRRPSGTQSDRAGRQPA